MAKWAQLVSKGMNDKSVFHITSSSNSKYENSMVMMKK